MAINLNFTSSNNGGGNLIDPKNVILNFGENATIQAENVIVIIQIIIKKPVFHTTINYLSNTSRPHILILKNQWQPTITKNIDAKYVWDNANYLHINKPIVWNKSINHIAIIKSSYMSSLITESKNILKWQDGFNSTSDISTFTSAYLADYCDLVIATWQQTNVIKAQSSIFEYKHLLPKQSNRLLPWLIAQPAKIKVASLFKRGRFFKHSPVIAWQIATYLPSGREPFYIKPPTPPLPRPSTILNFCCVLPSKAHNSIVRLNFGLHPCPEQSLNIPIKKVYFVINNISLKRITDNLPIDILSVAVATDKSSWCWSFNATIPYNQLDRVEPTANGPVEVELEINAIKWRFLIENYDQKRQFGKTGINISGRSTTAFLESPYAATRSFNQILATTSRQIAQEELVRVGLDTGFDLDWKLVDALGWEMPANTWSYDNLTPIQVIKALAEGAGGFVNSHPLNQQLQVSPDYIIPPWEWGLNSAAQHLSKVLPTSILKSQSLKWLEKPNYNGVCVSGENTGVTALIKRTGTAGDYQAPMFVSPIISHTDAARSKGISILSSGGKQATVGLDMPLIDGLGLITPGMLVEVVGEDLANLNNSWRGMVNSTSLSAAWNNGLTVSQSIELERHFGGF